MSGDKSSLNTENIILSECTNEAICEKVQNFFSSKERFLATYFDIPFSEVLPRAEANFKKNFKQDKTGNSAAGFVHIPQDPTIRYTPNHKMMGIIWDKEENCRFTFHEGDEFEFGSNYILIQKKKEPDPAPSEFKVIF